MSDIVLKGPGKIENCNLASPTLSIKHISLKYEVGELQRLSQKKNKKEKVMHLKIKHTWQHEKKHPQGQIQIPL